MKRELIKTAIPSSIKEGKLEPEPSSA